MPADVIGDLLPTPLPTPATSEAASVESVVVALLAAWWYPPEPITFPDLAERTAHLITPAWALQWTDTAATPLLENQTSSLQIVDIGATAVTDSTAQVSVVVERNDRSASYVFDLVNDGTGWRVDDVR